MRKEALDSLITWLQPDPLDRVEGRYRPLDARPASDLQAALASTAPTLLADASATAPSPVAQSEAYTLTAEPSAPPVVMVKEEAVSLSWQQTLIAIFVPVLVAGIKKVLPSLPKGWLPIIAGALGLIGQVLEALATGGTVNAALGFGLGLAGVGVREAAKHFLPSATPATA
jgi:hypothetical protein